MIFHYIWGRINEQVSGPPQTHHVYLLLLILYYRPQIEPIFHHFAHPQQYTNGRATTKQIELSHSQIQHIENMVVFDMDSESEEFVAIFNLLSWKRKTVGEITVNVREVPMDRQNCVWKSLTTFQKYFPVRKRPVNSNPRTGKIRWKNYKKLIL